MYRICWKALSTGVTGCGECVASTNASIQSFVNDLNSIYLPTIVHWLESCKELCC
jgi:hypothetical protein